MMSEGQAGRGGLRPARRGGGRRRTRRHHRRARARRRRACASPCSKAGRGSAASPSPSGAATSPSTTASTSTCAAAPPTAGSSTASTAPRLAPLQDRLDVPVLDAGPPGPPARPARAAPRCRCRCTWRASLATLPAPLARRARPRSAAPRSRCKRPRPGRSRRWTTGLRRAGCAAHGQSRRAVEALWDLVGRRHPQRRRRRLLARPGRDGVQDRAAVRPGRRRHRLGARPARRPARHPGPQGARLRGRAHRDCVPAPPPSPRTEDGRWSVDRVPGERHRRPTPSCSPSRSARRTTCCPRARSTTPNGCCAIGTAPILNVHVVYDRTGARPRRSSPRSAPRCSGSSTAPTPPGCAGGGSTSPCRSRPRSDEIDQPVAALRERYLPGAGAAAARRPRRRRSRTSSSPGSAPRPSRPPPGSVGCGPAPAPSAPGLYLAGAWTATGWPATMESAVRSGVSAAGRRARRPRTAPRSPPSSRRRHDARPEHDRPPHPRYRNKRRDCAHCAPGRNGCRRGGRDRAAGARPDPGHTGAAGRRGPPRTAHGHRRRLPLRLDRRPGQPCRRRRRQGGTPRARRCCPPRPPAPRPRWASPARSPSSWCTTSRCCTTT